MKFSPKVLLAKVNALLRRSSNLSPGAVSAGKILLQPNARKVYLDGQEITLTRIVTLIRSGYKFEVKEWLLLAERKEPCVFPLNLNRAT